MMNTSHMQLALPLGSDTQHLRRTCGWERFENGGMASGRAYLCGCFLLYEWMPRNDNVKSVLHITDAYKQCIER